MECVNINEIKKNFLSFGKILKIMCINIMSQIGLY